MCIRDRYGTLYTKAELEALHAVCQEYKMPLFLDGARPVSYTHLDVYKRQVWSIGSPVETATTSTRLLPRKPSRRNCVNLKQFLPLPQKQAFVSLSLIHI